MSMNKIILVLFLFILILVYCTKEKEVKTAPKVLIGWLTETKLSEEFPAYKQGKAAYQPEKEVLTQLDALNKNYEILVFLGTYCSDCKREVPRFFKIVDQLENQKFTYRLFGLNRSDADTSGMREKYNIEFIPTFIVYHNGEEIGRIIERPMVSLERDLLEICSNL